MISARYLSLEERERIANLSRECREVREIARMLWRSPGMVSKELRCNRNLDGPYSPHQAQRLAAIRRLRPKPGKLVANTRPYTYIVAKLKAHHCWSPEQIAGRIRRDHPDEDTMRVCMETIYEVFYLDVKGGLGRVLGWGCPQADPGVNRIRLSVSDRSGASTR